MKRAIIGLLLSPFLLMAQQNDGAWTNIGPRTRGCRGYSRWTRRAPGTIFMGSIAGGVRKSVDGGNYLVRRKQRSHQSLRVSARHGRFRTGKRFTAGTLAGVFKNRRRRRHVAEYPFRADCRGRGPTRTGPASFTPCRLPQSREWLDQEEHRWGSYLGDYLSYDCCNFQHND